MSSTTAGFSTVNRFAVLEDHQSKSPRSKKQLGSDGDTSIKRRQGREDGKVDAASKSNGVMVNGNAKVNGTSNGNGNGKKQDHSPQSSKAVNGSQQQQSRSFVNGNNKTPNSNSTSKSPDPTAYLKTPAKKNSNSTSNSNSLLSRNNTPQSTLHDNSISDQAEMKVNGVTQQIQRLKKDLVKKETEVKERVVQKKKKTDWEVPRKTLHGSIGFLVLYLRSQNPLTIRPLLIILTTALIIITSTDVLRFNSPAFNRLYIKVLGPLMRKEEVSGWNGVIWYLIGVVVTVGVYPRDVAVVSILTLSWSDTAASTIGRLLGSHTPPLPAYLPLTTIPFAPRKSLAGFLAAALTGFLIGLSYWAGGKRVDGGWGELWGGNVDLTSWSGEKLGGWAFLQEGWGKWGTAGVLGLAGAVVEALDLGYDDNLTLPILTGAIVWIWLTVVSALTT